VSDGLRGLGVSAGVAVATAWIVRTEFPNVPDRSIQPEQVEVEIARLHAAAEAVALHLKELGERVLRRAGPEESRIFDAQIEMVRDPDFLGGVEQLIRSSRLAAETAYEFKALELRNAWANSSSAFIRDRIADLHAIQLRMIHQLLGKNDDEIWDLPSGEQVVIVARELSPGLTVQLDREHVAALVSEEGTRTSHAAILAHSLGIPAVMGVRGALERIPNGALLLVDGTAGRVTVEPTHAELEDARVRVSRRQRLSLKLEAAHALPAESPDGRRVQLLANVDLPDEIDAAVRLGAEGVGLLRTEFLLTGRSALPTEDEQTDYFRRVGRAFAGRPVVIRSYDLGGDKFPASFDAPAEANPFLGWRSIRVCLDQPDIFRTQLRALLRAAVSADIRLMLPLVISVDEVRQSKAMLAEEAAALKAAGIPAAETLPVGVMIETPAAVVLAEQFADESAFFSVGTNDLTQYTLALDRGNARLADRFTSFHPAVVRLLAETVRAAKAGGIPVSICGELASDPLGALLLVGLGADTLSVAAPSLPLVKWVLRTVPASAWDAAAAAALAARSPEAVRDGLGSVLAQHLDLRLLDEIGVAAPAGRS
jgi:phosphotransferase system enzyme I (PtsI)